MNEEERAERFARELDEFLLGGRKTQPPDLDDEDLESLLDVASRRLDRGGEARLQAEAYEAGAWERLLERLEGDDPGATDPAVADVEKVADGDLTNVMSLRKQMSEDALALAELHRQDVWDRVQARLAEDSHQRPAIVVDPSSEDPSRSDAGDEFDSLVRIALGNAHAPPRDPEMTARLWARVGGLPDPRALDRSLDAHWGNTGIPVSLTVKAVVVAVVMALGILALGLLPTAGLDEHPLAQAISRISG